MPIPRIWRRRQRDLELTDDLQSYIDLETEAGIASVLFGPGGAGLHSIEEYVLIEDVYACRDILVDATRRLIG